MLVAEGESGELQEGENLEAEGVVVGEAEQLGVGIEGDHGGLAFLLVIPAKAGIHRADAAAVEAWIPAFAGMTAGVVGVTVKGT